MRERLGKLIGWGLLGLCFVSLGSCQRGAPILNPVSGRVSYRGAALQTGTVVFSPDSSRGQRGPIAIGQITPDGSYQLKTDDQPGAQAGHYRVTVTCLLPSRPVAGQPFAIPMSLIPEQYSDVELSRLTCEVKASRNNALDFNLE